MCSFSGNKFHLFGKMSSFFQRSNKEVHHFKRNCRVQRPASAFCQQYFFTEFYCCGPAGDFLYEKPDFLRMKIISGCFRACALSHDFSCFKDIPGQQILEAEISLFLQFLAVHQNNPRIHASVKITSGPLNIIFLLYRKALGEKNLKNK